MDRSKGTIINQDSSGTDGEGDRVGVGEELEVGVGDWVGRVFILATQLVLSLSEPKTSCPAHR